MSNEVRASALRSTLNEIRNACPDVQTAFIFNQNGSVSAKDDDTQTENTTNAANIFNVLAERAETLGSLKFATFYGAQSKMHISQFNDSYIATVVSPECDEKYIDTLTQVLVPAVLRIVDTIDFSATQIQAPEDELESPSQPVADQEEFSEQPTIEAEPVEPETEEQTSEPEPESSFPEPPATQFMVEHLGGLLVPSDTVRIDNAVILQWKELYGEREIAEVDLESLNGQTTRCKFKPIRDSKQEGKGVIQMPEKIQFTLQLSKGELVMVKPVIDWRGTPT